MSVPNPKVDDYLRKAKKWQREIGELRAILLGTGMTEEFKWGKPCYTFQEKNVVIILPLKGHCALLFSKGALLKDPQGVLIQPTENTQAARQMRFTDAQEIEAMEPVLKSYLQDAIAVEKAGLEVVYKETADFSLPEELQKKLEEDSVLKAAFAALTPGRQRGYLLYFSAAKQAKTRESRVEKYRSQILLGKGIHD